MKWFIVSLFILIIWALELNAQFSGGNGTQANPYLISSKADMEALADSVAKGNYWSRYKYFELTQDITTPVTKSVGGVPPNAHGSAFVFNGNFDGKGFKITLNIITTTQLHIGCFGFAEGATIQNLIVDGRVQSNFVCGGVVGYAGPNTTIRNCINFCEVLCSQHITGGITSRVNEGCILENCINLGSVNGRTTQTGGITGDGQGRTIIRNNLNLGEVISSSYAVGGINGDRTNDNISNCINAGFIPNGNSIYGNDAITGLSNCINVGVTQRNSVNASCRYDKQLTPWNSLQDYGILVDSMVGTSLSNILDNNYWEFEDSLYPRLKNMPLEEPGYVAASPVFFRINNSSDYDSYDNVRYCFKVSNKHNVKWRSKNGLVEINNTTGFVKLLSLGWDTLTAYLVEPRWGIEITKIIPINITALNNDCFIEEPLSLTLLTNPNNIGSTIGSGSYDSNTHIPVEVILDDCYRFICWTNLAGDTISYKQIDTITLISDSVLIAEFEKYNFDLDLSVEPLNAGITTGTGIYPCDTMVEISVEPNDCYQFICWTNSVGDTISYKQIDTILISQNSALTAVFQGTGDLLLEIKIDTFLNVKPNLSRYIIPIYITSNKSISNFTLDNIVLTINKNVFYPRSISRGKMQFSFDGDSIDIKIDSIIVQNLTANTETLLFQLRGSPILGSLYTSDILINTDNIALECGTISSENGFISIEICEEGGDRLLTADTSLPKLIVMENPVKDILQVMCYCLERGNYSLEITDILGNVSVIHEWRSNISEEHSFDIPIPTFPIGNYILTMKTPNSRYHKKISIVN